VLGNVYQAIDVVVVIVEVRRYTQYPTPYGQPDIVVTKMLIKGLHCRIVSRIVLITDGAAYRDHVSSV
jgi:hypothetical protein